MTDLVEQFAAVIKTHRDSGSNEPVGTAFMNGLLKALIPDADNISAGEFSQHMHELGQAAVGATAFLALLTYQTVGAPPHVAIDKISMDAKLTVIKYGLGDNNGSPTH